MLAGQFRRFVASENMPGWCGPRAIVGEKKQFGQASTSLGSTQVAEICRSAQTSV